MQLLLLEWVYNNIIRKTNTYPCLSAHYNSWVIWKYLILPPELRIHLYQGHTHLQVKGHFRFLLLYMYMFLVMGMSTRDTILQRHFLGTKTAHPSFFKPVKIKLCISNENISLSRACFFFFKYRRRVAHTSMNQLQTWHLKRYSNPNKFPERKLKQFVLCLDCIPFDKFLKSFSEFGSDYPEEPTTCWDLCSNEIRLFNWFQTYFINLIWSAIPLAILLKKKTFRRKVVHQLLKSKAFLNAIATHNFFKQIVCGNIHFSALPVWRQ